MEYTQRDLDFIRIFSDTIDDPNVPPRFIEEALRLTAIFHYLFAVKLVEKRLGKSEFDFDLSHINKKFDAILEQFKTEKN